MKCLNIWLLSLVLLALSSSCELDEKVPVPKLKEAEVKQWSSNVRGSKVKIDGFDINVSVPFGTDIEWMNFVADISENATIFPNPSRSIDCSLEKYPIFKVTSEDGKTINEYILKVTVRDPVIDKVPIDKFPAGEYIHIGDLGKLVIKKDKVDIIRSGNISRTKNKRLKSAIVTKEGHYELTYLDEGQIKPYIKLLDVVVRKFPLHNRKITSVRALVRGFGDKLTLSQVSFDKIEKIKKRAN